MTKLDKGGAAVTQKDSFSGIPVGIAPVLSFGGAEIKQEVFYLDCIKCLTPV